MPNHDRLLEALARDAPCGLLATDPRSTILTVNETLLRWLGHERDALVGRRRFPDLMRVGGKIFYETHFGPLLRMQGWVEEIALELRTAEGGTLPVFVSANEQRDANGEPYHFQDDRKLRSLPVTADQRKQLARGKLDIVRDGDRYELVPAAVGDKIRERLPECVVERPKEENKPDEDDPYAGYEVPDDLMW